MELALLFEWKFRQWLNWIKQVWLQCKIQTYIVHTLIILIANKVLDWKKEKLSWGGGEGSERLVGLIPTEVSISLPSVLHFCLSLLCFKRLEAIPVFYYFVRHFVTSYFFLSYWRPAVSSLACTKGRSDCRGRMAMPRTTFKTRCGCSRETVARLILIDLSYTFMTNQVTAQDNVVDKKVQSKGKYKLNGQAPVVQRLDTTIQWINRYPVDKC